MILVLVSIFPHSHGYPASRPLLSMQTGDDLPARAATRR
jgi:hypothetical protein